MTLERTLDAPIEDIWDLWTTKDGIESWWGPDGFSVRVKKIELRPGGRLEYVMKAVDPDMLEGLKAMGAPLETEVHATYTEIVPWRRLGYDHRVDFIPDTDPYDVAHLVEFHEGPKGVRMVLTFDAMHADMWNDRAIAGWKQEFQKLADALGSE